MKPLIALLLVAALIGCNRNDAAELKDDAGSLVETAARSAGNASVAARVNTALALRKDVDMSGLHIEAEGGTVTVGGHVATKADKDRVLALVKLTRGVDKVIDELRVEP